MKKLSVGNLPFQATGSDLEELFAAYGEVVSAQVFEDRETGRSRGFGFLEMADGEVAQLAIDALHDYQYGGRRLTVNEARPREAGVGGSRGRGDYGGVGRGRSDGYGGYVGGYGGSY